MNFEGSEDKGEGLSRESLLGQEVGYGSKSRSDLARLVVGLELGE